MKMLPLNHVSKRLTIKQGEKEATSVIKYLQHI